MISLRRPDVDPAPLPPGIHVASPRPGSRSRIAAPRYPNGHAAPGTCEGPWRRMLRLGMRWVASRDDDLRLSRVPRAAATEQVAVLCPARRGGRVPGGDVLRPFRAVEHRPGPQRLRVVVAGRGHAGDQPGLRLRQRAGAALPPGDRRPGRRHARRDVPRTLLGGPRQRRGPQRAHHRNAVAAQAGSQRAPAGVRRGHARCWLARPSPIRGWSPSTKPSCGRDPRRRRRCSAAP